MKFFSIGRRFLAFLLVLFFCFSCVSSFAEEIGELDADAVYEEGQQYITGLNVEQNVPKGIALIVLAANAGSAKAMIEVGAMYSSGFGRILSSDYQEGDEVDLALYWYEKAAEAGEKELAAAAISTDAFSYFLGSEDGFIQEDDAVALRYFQKAAEYGDPDAINMMVAFYSYGFGVEQDPGKALELGSSLAEKGNAEALYSLEDYAYAYYAGTKEGIDINFNTAFSYYSKLTEFGNERAMYNVGLLYEFGLGVASDHAKAVEWITKSRDAGYEPAEELLVQLTAN